MAIEDITDYDEVEIFSPELKEENRKVRQTFSEPIEIWVNDHLVYKSYRENNIQTATEAQPK